ncbi:MAG: D-alanyl-D-alanine carboxypeptidase [Siculibacillus sp.]
MSYSRIFEPARLMKAALVGLALVIVATSTAEAGRRHSRRAHHAVRVDRGGADDGIAATGRYAAYVVDDKTGRVLFSKNADEPRHPASLTKMMTLYLLFEEIERKRMTTATRLTASAKAAAQSPSKLGLRPGQTISVEDAIRALVTKSANDVAVTIAENVGGSEAAFAKRMTQTARRIGMRGTTFHNASGLPNSAQITTARDMVILGRALQERFPSQYRYFSTRSFAWGDNVIGNHNRLLYRLEGVDGIKTGYTAASGFNLVSSMRRDGRHVVASVLGGSSARQRDDHMAALLTQHIAAASSGAKVSSVLRDAGRSADASFDDDGADEVRAETRVAAAAPAVETTPANPSAPEKITSEPLMLIAPQAEAPVAAAPAPAQPTASGRPGMQPRLAGSDVVPITRTPDSTRPAYASSDHGAAVAMARAILLPQQSGLVPSGRSVGAEAAPVRTASAETTPSVVTVATRPVAPPSLATATISMADVAEITTGSVPRRKAEEPAQAATSARSGWLVQIGAFDGEAAARGALANARNEGGAVLARTEGFTESIGGSGRMWRARFAGFKDQSAADDACKALKRKKIACLALRQ